MLHTDDATLESAFLGLVDRLWERRDVGVTHPEAVNLLDQTLPGDGKHALMAFRHHGLLASDSPIRILDGAIADYLFATRLEGRIREGFARLSELEPERDATVVEVLTRRTSRCPELVGALTDRDDRHGGPIARGLAQRTPDVTNVALAASLARAGGNRLLDIDGCGALGTLAARDRRAFRIVANMYLDADRAESLRGAEALAHTMEYQPHRVGHIVRFRLRRELLRSPATGRRSLARRLSDALHPLHRVAHGDAASTSREILGELARRVDLPALPDAAALLDTVDLVRGQVIPFEGDGSIAGLLDELGSDNAAARFRAAAVVRSVSQVIPERIVDPLCDVIGRENDPHVLGRLLLATYRVLEFAPEKLLAAVRASRAVTWEATYPAGSALAFLGHAAPLDPRAVFGLLPRRLDGLPPWARACLADVLSFAWWRLAEVEPGARPTLESLATPDLAGVPRSFRVFAHRGASIAALGILSIGAADAADTTVSMTRDPDGQPPYFYTNTRDFLARRARSISRHPRAGWLADTLVRVVQAGHGLLVHPGLDRLNGAQRIASQNALDDLVEIISGREDSLAYLRQLPRDWESMYGVRRLLERGARGEQITEFAGAACDEHARSGTMGALHERDVLLGRLALGRDDAGDAVVARIADRSPSLLGAATPGRAQAVISYIDQHPSEILTQIEAVVAEQDGVLALFHWRIHARSWQAILVSQVFGRMFDSRPIGYREASRLVDQILAVVRSLPDSRLGEEYKVVYEAINSWLHSAPIEIARKIPAGPAVRASHAWTARLLHRANEARSSGEGAEWLDLFIRDRGLWWQTDGYSLGEGSLSRSVGGAKQIIYMFPALRLGLLAVGRAHGRPDPAGAFMTARYELVPRLERAHIAIGYERDPGRLERAARELEGAVPQEVWDERVLSTAGHLLLNAGRLEEAEDRLRTAAASSMIRDEDRASVLYNLSCVMARAGREGECRCALEEAIQLMPHLRTSLSADADLSSVSERPWFVALLADDPARPPGGPEAFSDHASAEVRFDHPLVELAPDEVPARFEGWEIRYAIVEVYDREFPAWGRAIRAAFSVQFPGGTITVVSIPELAESLAISPPEGTAPEIVAATTAVAHRVLAVLSQMAMTPARPESSSDGNE